jgi:hypothetical protein
MTVNMSGVRKKKNTTTRRKDTSPQAKAKKQVSGHQQVRRGFKKTEKGKSLSDLLSS